MKKRAHNPIRAQVTAVLTEKQLREREARRAWFKEHVIIDGPAEIREQVKAALEKKVIEG